ncbi:hypothetical protein [Sphingomonas solaris]|uniref:Uncharacterized protein n=1 Tax=Alterirhizorhabdus solaris TaxID=2529389 RepID=A0A558RBU5_9SPHN|nr:hypothetical protein [Sphingomonas solaris]TVV76808.1 hypothetical protein FOY91_02765 [Sphingomonas solaris]
MNLRLVDWIWNVSGSVALPRGQSAEEAFARIDPLFRQPGTTHERAGDTLTFRKRDQAAQDRMAVFDGGVLRIERGVAGPLLRYRLTSRMLLFCFFLPLLFLGFAGLTIVVSDYQKPSAEAAAKAKKEAAAKKKPDVPMNPLDKALGAPAPDKAKKDKKDEDKSQKPTSAYVFAGIFALLYIVGRILEARLFRSLLRKKLEA